jgi:hypothetical protein
MSRKAAKVAPTMIADGSEAQRIVGKPFQKGQSGNPGGMPKGVGEVKKLARAFTRDAIETLAQIMKDLDQPASARVGAATALLDRGYGKPLQQVEHGDAGAFSDMDDAALDAYILSKASKFVEERRTIN